MSTCVEAIGASIANFPADDLPGEVVQACQRQLLDVFTTVGAACGKPIGDIPARVGASIGGTGEATIWFSAERSSAAGAAFANAQRSVAMDLGSNLFFSQGLPGVVIAPALALAHERDVDGRRLLAAIACGFESAGRVALSMPPPYRPEGPAIKGHSSPRSRWIAFGAAAAVAHVLGLSAEQAANAVALAGSMLPIPPGPAIFGAGIGSMVKYGMAGVLAANAVAAGLLAEQGFTGDLEMLEKDGAFYAAMGVEQYDAVVLSTPLGEPWLLFESNFKRCQSGTHNQQALHALARMRAQHGVLGDDIKQIRVGRAIGLSGAFSNPRPAGDVEAQFSLPFGAAMVLLDVPIDEWPAHLTDPAALRICDTVVLESESEAVAEFHDGFARRPIRSPWQLRTRVRVNTDREVIDQWSDYGVVSFDELTAKAARFLPDASATGERAVHLAAAVRAIAEPGGIQRLLDVVSDRNDNSNMDPGEKP